jgi:hypothetical protein
MCPSTASQPIPAGVVPRNSQAFAKKPEENRLHLGGSRLP